MAQWGLFVAFSVALTAVILFLARQSQELLGRVADESASESEISSDAPASGEGLASSAPASGEGIPPDVPATQTPGSGERVPPNTSDGSRPGGEVELTPGAMLVNLGATQGLVALAVIVAAWSFDVPATALGVTDDAMGLGTLGVGAGLALGLVLWVGNELSTTVADAVGASYDERIRALLAPDSPAGWVVLLAVVLPLVSLGEELLFRAALVGAPAAGFDVSPWLLAVVSSLAFALGHGAQGRVGVVVTGLLGFALAAGYILTGSLLVVVVAHYVINALEFLVHEYLGADGLLPFATLPVETSRN